MRRHTCDNVRRYRFAQRLLLVDVVFILAIDAERPGHHQFFLVLGFFLALLTLHLRPLLENGGAVFQRLKNTARKNRVGPAALPTGGQYLADDLGSIEERLGINFFEADGEFELDRAKQVGSRRIEMLVKQVYQRLGAVIPARFGDRVHQPVVGSPRAGRHPARLDQFVR